MEIAYKSLRPLSKPAPPLQLIIELKKKDRSNKASSWLNLITPLLLGKCDVQEFWNLPNCIWIHMCLVSLHP